MMTTQTTRKPFNGREWTNTRRDRRLSPITSIYSDGEVSIASDSDNFTLQVSKQPARYYSSLSSLFGSILNIKMKKSLSMSTLDIPVEQFKEITDRAVAEVHEIAGVIRFTLNDHRLNANC